MSKAQGLIVAITLGLVLGVLALLWTRPIGSLAEPGLISTAASVIRDPIPISTLNINEQAPAVAYDSARREHMVVWHNSRPSADDDIYAQRVAADGKLLSWFHIDVDTQAPLIGDRNCPAVAYSIHHGDYLVVYSRQDASGRWDVMGMRANIFGPQGDEFTIAISTTLPNSSEDRAVVAYNPLEDNYLVAWSQPAGSDTEIWGRLVAGTAGGGDGGGEFIGSANNLTAPLSDDCGSPDLAFHPGRNQYMLAFDHYVSGVGSEVMARLIHANGVYSTGAQITISPDGDSPSAAVIPEMDTYLVAYRSTSGAGQPEIYLFRTGGNLVGVVNSSLTPSPVESQADPDIARLGNSGIYQVVWSAQLPAPGGRGIMGRRFTTAWDFYPAFDIHVVNYDYENVPAVSDGSPTTLAVWEHDGPSTYEIFGQLLGYQIHLPLVLRFS